MTPAIATTASTAATMKAVVQEGSGSATKVLLVDTPAASVSWDVLNPPSNP